MSESAQPRTRAPVSAESILEQIGAAEALAARHQNGTRGWDGDPVPLTPRRLLPPFPVDVLPPWVGDQVAAVAEFTQTPPDLAGCVALAALSAAAGGRAMVEIRPGWREPVNIYTAVAMPPGSRKSAVFAAMTAPLLAAERALVEQVKPLVVHAAVSKRAAERAAERSADAAANATVAQARSDALAAATADALAVEEINIPARPRLIADDITTETAASLLAEQGGRLAVLSAEGGIFTTLAGRYTGGIPSLEVFLKGHAGDMLRVDRKSRESEHVDRPALTLGLAIQPEVLADIARMPGFRGRGLLARILYSVPPNNVGRRRPGAPAVPDRVAETYESTLSTLVLSLFGHADPAVISFTRTADAAVLAHEVAIEPRLSETGDLGHVADWASKLTGAIARLAGLLHIAGHIRDGWTAPIEAGTVRGAELLGHYFTAHALAVFDLMGADPVVDDAHAILDWIIRNQPQRFTRRELFTGISRARFRKVGDLDAPLALLEQLGYVRQLEQPPSNGGRRPSPPYEVHPRAADVGGSKH